MFLDGIKEMPLPASAQAAATGLSAWADAARRGEDAALAARAEAVAVHPAGRALLEGIFGCSPHLTAEMTRDPAFACGLLETGPDAAFDAAMAEVAALPATPLPNDAVMTALRRGKRRGSLAIALADITGTWPLERVTDALSRLAEATLDGAVARVLREAAELRGIDMPEQGDPLPDCGLIVLGMGKLGAGELNYSSDVDLILLYDEERVRTSKPDRLNQTFVRMARNLVRLMSERTADGYVFRTDLRLRPDPASTPLAMSTQAAEAYYESMGQNWERAAMLKARPVAGDRTAGEAFLQHLRPFVWRRSLDFETIRDIHSIKRQINAHRGGASIAVAGHNVKLGRGGIREIEFFAQTQQLIWGGRDPALRERATVPALAALAAAGHIDDAARDEMAEAYRYLRRVEHRLQMVADQQTHSLPAAEGLTAIARFLGYADGPAFEGEIRQRLETVEGHYAVLFEEEASLSGPGNLVFTGADDDPDTIETLRGMGFREPATVAGMVRGWHHGRVRPTRSVRARELLTELMPTLLGELAKTPDPDAAIRKFDAFLAGLPAGVQLFSLFHANPSLLSLVAEIMGASRHLADRLSRHPVVLDAVLTEGFFAPPPPKAEIEAELNEAFGLVGDLQDALDAARRWANDRKFQIGVQMLRGTLDPLDACRALSDVADIAIARLQAAVTADFAAQHGDFPDDGLAVVAFGKLGSRELTVTSDLDLVTVYDAPVDARSGGPRPLAAAPYHIRLTQRLVTAITSQTGEGKLYEADLRLRPAGNDGPLATHLDYLSTYERQSAWTWEHMALTRARPISGPATLQERIRALRDEVLRAERDPLRLLADVAGMRERIAKSNRTPQAWDVKHMRGGLIDVEFIAQYLILRHARAHPEVIAVETPEAFRRLAAADVLSQTAADDLVAAHALWLRTQQILRLTADERFDAEQAPEALRELISRGAGCVDFADLSERFAHYAERARSLYEEIVAGPAAEIADDTTDRTE